MQNFEIWLARQLVNGTRRHFSSLHAEYLQEKRATMSEPFNKQHPLTDEQRDAALAARIAELEARVAELEAKVNN
jgi:uncharacterized protein YceH (UPF0502 family)